MFRTVNDLLETGARSSTLQTLRKSIFLRVGMADDILEACKCKKMLISLEGSASVIRRSLEYVLVQRVSFSLLPSKELEKS